MVVVRVFRFSQRGSASSASAEEIIPDLTVESAVAVSIIRRFPSDLIESSVDPGETPKRTASFEVNPDEEEEEIFLSKSPSVIRIGDNKSTLMDPGTTSPASPPPRAWGEPRAVTVKRGKDEQSLGMSIVGGKARECQEETSCFCGVAASI